MSSCQIVSEANIVDIVETCLFLRVHLCGPGSHIAVTRLLHVDEQALQCGGRCSSPASYRARPYLCEKQISCPKMLKYTCDHAQGEQSWWAGGSMEWERQTCFHEFNLANEYLPHSSLIPLPDHRSRIQKRSERVQHHYQQDSAMVRRAW